MRNTVEAKQPNSKPKDYAGTGRPTVMTPETINKLEEVFAIGGGDLEACFYAGISHESLYKYQREHPEFTERKEALKERPILKARQTIVKSLDDPINAKWYLERKRKKEFAQRNELTGEDGNPIQVQQITGMQILNDGNPIQNKEPETTTSS